MRVLSVDIETSPKSAYVWGLWKQNVAPNQMLSDWFMLTWSAKWLGEGLVMGEQLTPRQVAKENDKKLLKNLHVLLDEADVVISHNGDRFDIPSINTRFIDNGIMPPSPYRSIDTLKIAKRHFKFTSNRLDYIGQFLGVGKKIETGGFDLWRGCMLGDQSALDNMLTYNKQDVVLLEKVYLKLLPFVKIHPNVGVESVEMVCPSCGGNHLQKRGTISTNVSTFQRYRCNDCGSWSRDRKNVRSKEAMTNTLMSV